VVYRNVYTHLHVPGSVFRFSAVTTPMVLYAVVNHNVYAHLHALGGPQAVVLGKVLARQVQGVLRAAHKFKLKLKLLLKLVLFGAR
jgi:hypothetical protein